MRRGQVWDSSDGRVLLVGSDVLVHNTIPVDYALPVTTTSPATLPWPLVVPLELRDDQRPVPQRERPLWAMMLGMRPIRRDQLHGLVATTSTTGMHEVDGALAELLALKPRNTTAARPRGQAAH